MHSIAVDDRSGRMIDALTLDQMRIFVAAVDAGSFSAAARKLGRVQSAISQSIATLEVASRRGAVRPVGEDAAA